MTMPRKRYDVTPDGDDWIIQTGGRTVRRFETKQPAVDDAVGRGRRQGNSQVVIHRKNGTIQEERTYGEDPYPPEG